MALRDVIGQDKAVSILLRTLSRDRVPSAYLFAGEAGIGKRFTAMNLAKAVNCLKDRNSLVVKHDEKEDDDPSRVTHYASRYDCCDECPSCRKIDAGTHPDFVMVTPEKGEIRVNEIRAVEEALALRPFEGRRKVVVIDDADAMNQSAANAFLKTLEEPPDESLMILVASNPDRLPETVRSRCSRVSFGPLSPSACEKVIASAAGAAPGPGDRKGADSDRLPVLVRLSMGRPGLAVSSDRLKDRDRFVSLFRSMIEGESETWADRDEMEQWLDMMFLMMRDMAVLKIEEEACGKADSARCMGDKGILLNADLRNFMSDVSGKTGLKVITETYRKLTLLKNTLGFNLNKAITWNYVSGLMQDLKFSVEKR